MLRSKGRSKGGKEGEDNLLCRSARPSVTQSLVSQTQTSASPVPPVDPLFHSSSPTIADDIHAHFPIYLSILVHQPQTHINTHPDTNTQEKKGSQTRGRHERQLQLLPLRSPFRAVIRMYLSLACLSRVGHEQHERRHDDDDRH